MTRHTRLLQFTALASTLDRFAMPPMLLAISHDLGVPVAGVASAAGAYFLAYGLMQPVWGLLGSRLGVVRSLRLAVLLAALTTAGTALATDAASLVAFRLVAGAGFSAAVPAALFYAGATAAPGRRHRDITGLMAGVALGTAAATAGAGALAATVGWRSAFLFTGTTALVACLVLSRLPELPAPRAAADGIFAPLRAVLRSGPARTLLLLATVEGGILLGVLTFLPAAVGATGSGAALAGGVTAAYGVAVLICAPIVGRLQQRVPAAALIAAGAALAAIGCVVAAFTATPVAGAFVCLLIGAAWASMHSTMQTWATEVVPEAGLTAVSLFAGALFTGSALAAVAGGPPVEAGRFGLVFGVAAALLLPLGVAGATARARWRPPVAVPSPVRGRDGA
ncbi:MFS transporter [Phytohabitans sp. ZYX-F-186]|uniref:MFS transporter n=1 Tax=Phytohabitans maris TaxID=3071409 RepID=A0ABU0ZD62_9ACTN|nr:MFS transporter [Phytohabitans sp. ZYX-F-186]MDQ7904250.1 MFS transporter [Phytohabitans sp. ZYX-F-186]